MWNITARAKTFATKECVWNIWMNVPSWNVWDSDIEYSELYGLFQIGTQGMLKPRNGPKVKFEIREYSVLESFTIRSYLPLCQLEFVHQLKETDGQLEVTHKVEMKGPMSIIFSRILGDKIKVALPNALRKLIEIAESSIKRGHALNDDEFEYLFANCLLVPECFSHEAHIRLAWIHVRKYGIDQAVKNVTSQIRIYTAHAGMANKYNETLTVASIQIVRHFMQKSGSQLFEEFISSNPALKHDFRDLISTHYGFDIFNSIEAKQRYLEPDLLPFS